MHLVMAHRRHLDPSVSVPIICQPGMRFSDGVPPDYSPTDTDEEDNVDLAPFLSGELPDDTRFIPRHCRILYSMRNGPMEGWPTHSQLRFLTASALSSLIVCDPTSAASPTGLRGWAHWLAIYKHMARNPIPILREPYCPHYWHLIRTIAPIVPPMVFMESHCSPLQFQGWFPSAAFSMVLADRGLQPDTQELNLIVSVLQMFPIAPDRNPYVAVPMFRILTVMEDEVPFTFISLEPSLKIFL